MRCLLCDDHPIVLMSQSMMLEAHGHEVVASATDPSQVADLVALHGPDVVVTDLFFGDDDRGEAALRMIGEIASVVDVVVLSGSVDAEVQAAVESAGAAACISKAAPPSAVLAVVEGRSDSGGVVDLAEVERTRRDQHFLTPREVEVLQCLADGDSTERIAAHLGMRHATARSHVQSVLLKLGVHTRTAAVARGIRCSLVEPTRSPARRRPVWTGEAAARPGDARSRTAVG